MLNVYECYWRVWDIVLGNLDWFVGLVYGMIEINSLEVWIISILVLDWNFIVDLLFRVCEFFYYFKGGIVDYGVECS